jgi:hypothetical protein
MKQANKNKGKKATVLRIPRPLGTTARMYALKKTEQTDKVLAAEEYREIQRSIVESWASNSMRLNDRTYTIEQLKQYTGCTDKEIDKYMWRAMGKMGKVMEKKEVGQMARVLFSEVLKKSLEIQALTADQVAILASQQGSAYVPFLTSALNQALANLNSTQGPMMGLLKMLTEKHDTNIIYNTQINNNGTSQTFLNAEAAMKLIQSNEKSMLEDPHLAQEQVEKYKLAGLLPDINARTQNVGELTKPKFFLNPAEVKDTPSPTSRHEDRREAEVGPILLEEEDDFKA